MVTSHVLKDKKNIHLGRNTQRIREMIGMKQSALASNTGFTQQYISKLEQSATFADEVLEKLADGLGVTADIIKNFNEEKAIYNIQSHFTYNEGSSNANLNWYPTINNNSIDKVVELFERLLKSEKEKVSLLSNVNKAIKDLGEQIHTAKRSRSGD